jgi:hypothetical protein
MSQILRKFCPFRYRKPPGHQTDLTKIESHIIIYTANTEKRKNIEGYEREKKQITYKGKQIRITADFSVETLKARRA